MPTVVCLSLTIHLISIENNEPFEKFGVIESKCVSTKGIKNNKHVALTVTLVPVIDERVPIDSIVRACVCVRAYSLFLALVFNKLSDLRSWKLILQLETFTSFSHSPSVSLNHFLLSNRYHVI